MAHMKNRAHLEAIDARDIPYVPLQMYEIGPRPKRQLTGRTLVYVRGKTRINGVQFAINGQYKNMIDACNAVQELVREHKLKVIDVRYIEAPEYE
jgi:hypothetical protein